ncbi:hypothetical protein BKH43_04235 [Helicobacter sp. 13S00401-1]|uniref:methylated-DNA--[protein]-cysteine S-methyltransferase n=1 Tax=Helicobacter sp. 13S00401-1 TaxID=1905758 RepID=UPI000BA66400|nr:methylated-DNA--[protein]-cysteine S-methyltransferase [Helicobacter sp. 13S00401-1]PAF50772.1 hypothetical protein BKH43_04235 [Helicobacter sp. 13S00401-1]
MACLICESPIGKIVLVGKERLESLSVFKEKDELDSLELERYKLEEDKTNPLLLETKKELDAYFKGRLKSFSVPLDLKGSPFTLSVYKALLNVKYGEVVSYKDIACAINNPRACRAVGNANSKNPISIIVPCHRIVAFNMGLGGYAYGLDMKRFLLKLEGANFKGLIG